MRCIGLRALGIILFLAGVGLAQPPSPPQPLAKPTPGQELYARHCAACHGQTGDGQGLAAKFLYPKPRSFRTSKYRLISTDNMVPTRDDLNAVLLRGMPGSSMPSWAHLTQDERNLLIDEIVRLTNEGAADRYVKLLKEREQLTDADIAADPEIQAEIKAAAARPPLAPGPLVAVPPLREGDAEAIARGKAIYARQGCITCHGPTGKGDGTQKMMDDEGYVMRARDLTRGIYKGGDDAASIFRRIRIGMPGTPMPASRLLTDEEVADLTYYLRSLSTDEQRLAAVTKRERILVRKVAALPADSDARAWQMASPAQVRLMPLWWRDNAVFAVQVQAVHDGRSIAFRLEWADAEANTDAGKTESFKDAAALELVAGPQEPFLGMGSADTPIDLWMWDAARGQSDGDLEQINPRVVVDIYPFNEQVVESAEYNRDGTKTAAQPDLAFPARATGNQVSPSAAHSTGGSSLTAAGPGSTTFRIQKSQLVSATGRWSNGRWTVLVRRSLTVASPEDGLGLTPGQTASVALAVWDGAHRDRNGQKQVSIWQELVLER